MQEKENKMKFAAVILAALLSTSVVHAADAPESQGQIKYCALRSDVNRAIDRYLADNMGAVFVVPGLDGLELNEQNRDRVRNWVLDDIVKRFIIVDTAAQCPAEIELYVPSEDEK